MTDDITVIVHEDVLNVTISEVGAAGAPGPAGDDGSSGANGADGEDGASAYEVAVAAGFVGTIEQWLESLQGATGPKGDKGDQGDGAAPAGANKQVQYNDGGVAGATNQYYDKATGYHGIGTDTPGAFVEIKGNGQLMRFRGGDGALLGRLAHDTVTLAASMGRFAIEGNHGTLDAGGLLLDRTQNMIWSNSTVDYGTPDTNLNRKSPGVIGFGTGSAGSTDGKAELSGVIWKSPNGTRYLETIDNAGAKVIAPA